MLAMPTLTRRHLLAGAAATAAVAAMPAGAIAKSGIMTTTFKLEGVEGAAAAMEELAAEAAAASVETVTFMEAIAEAKLLSQKALAGVPADAQWVWFADEDGRPITGDVEIVRRESA